MFIEEYIDGYTIPISVKRNLDSQCFPKTHCYLINYWVYKSFY